MTGEEVAALEFRGRAELEHWFEAHHAQADVLWVRLYRKGSGVASVTWDDCVHVALAYGWIDGLKRPHASVCWLQRLTPRRRGSAWSPRNRAIAEELMAAGRMRPAGLAAIRVAQENGRWDAAQKEKGGQ
jgi:uncharacterized protein YdeI (YjbR/CyaY-like superfamily)